MILKTFIANLNLIFHIVSFTLMYFTLNLNLKYIQNL